MLSEAQIEEYNEKGYVVPDYRLPTEMLERIREDHQRLLTKHPEFRNNCPALLRYDMGFLNYALDPSILKMAAQLIGPDICLWNMSFFAKPALNGQRTPYHQDGEYWPIRPLATCTVWIAIDAANEENGCLRYIPGSHKSARLMAHEVSDDPNITLNRELVKAEYDESVAESLILPEGGMAFHDIYIAHGSEENQSPNPRRGMTLRLMPSTSVYDRSLARQRHTERGGQDMSHHPLFLLSGRDVSQENDFVVRPIL